MPSCTFTDPELPRIGLTERKAGRHGIAYRVAKLPMAAVPRTRTLGETRGLMKALVAAEGTASWGSPRSARGPPGCRKRPCGT